MTTREKTLLTLMGVSLVFGISRVFLFRTPEADPSESLAFAQQAKELAREVANTAGKLRLKPEQDYVFAAAARPVSGKPFAAPNQRQNTANPTQPDPLSGQLYSGYIAVGRQHFAIIGGLEYAVGDKIPGTGDIVRDITPDKVILYSPNRKILWELPYTGDAL